ncbi:MAG: hypothetical protein B7Z54_08060, partial [Sphingobacteriales bacterium 12-47-4]
RSQARKNDLTAKLADPAIYSDKGRFLETETAFKKAEEDIAKLTIQYEQVFENIMQLEEKTKN